GRRHTRTRARSEADRLSRAARARRRGLRGALTAAVQPHPLDQALRHRIAATDGLHGVAQLGLEVVALAAVGAGAEVLLDHRHLVLGQLPVKVGLQLALDAQTWIKAHDRPPMLCLPTPA